MTMAHFRIFSAYRDKPVRGAVFPLSTSDVNDQFAPLSPMPRPAVDDHDSRTLSPPLAVPTPSAPGGHAPHSTHPLALCVAYTCACVGSTPLCQGRTVVGHTSTIPRSLFSYTASDLGFCSISRCRRLFFLDVAVIGPVDVVRWQLLCW